MVKVNEATEDSDIVAFALRSNTDDMKKMAKFVNSCGISKKIHTKSYKHVYKLNLFMNKYFKVKSIRFMNGMAVDYDIYNGNVDVFVTLENDKSEYWFEVTTPQALASHMDKTKQGFLEPLYPFIINCSRINIKNY